jgi:hypothetical protein
MSSPPLRSGSNESSAKATDSIRRTRTVIDKEVQYGVVRKVAFHWVAFMTCNTIALVLWVSLFEQPDAKWSETLMECVQRFLPFFVISAALIPAFVLDTLKMTNRFAGPISRLRNEIGNVTAGRPVTKLSFRSNDYWSEIADGFNAMVDKLGCGIDAPSKPAKRS